jgi:hypothetical protein
VRELREVIRKAVRRCKGERIAAADLKLGPEGAGEGEVSAYLRQAIHAASRSCQAGLFDLLKRSLVDVLWTETHDPEEIARRTGLPGSDVDRILQELGCLSPPPPSPPPPPPLSPSRAMAWGLYLEAHVTNPTLMGRSYAQVFRWLEERLAGGLPPFEPGLGEGRQGLPEKCETFKKYVREARAYHADPRNTSAKDG